MLIPRGLLKECRRCTCYMGDLPKFPLEEGHIEIDPVTVVGQSELTNNQHLDMWEPKPIQQMDCFVNNRS